MKIYHSKGLVVLAIFSALASISSAQLSVNLGYLTNGFNSAALFQSIPIPALPLFDYAIGVGNTGNWTIAGYTFEGDAFGIGTQTTSFIDPTGLGYSMSGTKSYNQNVPSMTGPNAANLDQLLTFNRYGNNNAQDSFVLPVTAGHTYDLQLLMWENYYSGPSGGRSNSLSINIGSGFQQAFTIGNDITDLAGPVVSNAFLWSFSFTPTTNFATLDFGPGGSEGGPILNGILLTETVPEPSTALLVLFGGAAVCFGCSRRRQRQAGRSSHY